MWRWMIVLALAASVFGNFYHLRPYAPFHKRNPQKYCGADITAALQIICNGVYNPMFKKSPYGDDGDFEEVEEKDETLPVNTRETSGDEDRQVRFSEGGYGSDDDNDDDEEEEDAEGLPLKPKENALSMFSKNYLRAKKGIYDECCRKSCSISELKTYCDTPKENFKNFDFKQWNSRRVRRDHRPNKGHGKKFNEDDRKEKELQEYERNGYEHQLRSSDKFFNYEGARRKYKGRNRPSSSRGNMFPCSKSSSKAQFLRSHWRI